MGRSNASVARTLTITAALALVGLFVAWREGRMPRASAHHTPEELAAFRGARNITDLPIAENGFFMASGNCYGCHGPDVVNNYSMVDANGVDVNVSDDWRSTMMANSAKDPFWRAKVSHEVSVNPAHQVGLEDKCTSCHAPMGKFDKLYTEGTPYSIAELIHDTVALDGVSCLACHMQKEEGIGLEFSGNLHFDTNNVVFGPYGNVFGSPMTSFVGYEPLFGAHVTSAELCAGCHSLITETADLEGNLTGDRFVEQATYHEWVNSSYDTDANPEGGVSCQSCHAPRIDDAVVISSNYLFLQGRTPYGLHHFAGANTFMLGLLRDNIEALGITATPTQFDSTIARADRMLKQNTLLLDAQVMARDLDTVGIDVKLTNLAGHKFPSGYPARRAFVELMVQNAVGDTLFHSGGWNAEYEVNGHNASWEPHHDVIRSEDQAQIYELVMGDVNGDRTTVLERGKSALKDNRLPPLGFSTGHPSYDTTLIANVPSSDVDFNHYGNGMEGSGTDVVHYRVPMNGYAGQINVTTRVWYQSAPPRYMTEMFTFDTPEITTFRAMYEAAGPAPVLVKEATTNDMTVAVDNVRELGVRIFPNPVADGLLRVDGISDRVRSIEVYTIGGQLVGSIVPAGRRQWQVALPQRQATYVVVFGTAAGRLVERVVAY
jgi:hypothetical protein